MRGRVHPGTLPRAPSYYGGAMLDHLSLSVTDLARAAAFYDAGLGALGYVRVWTASDAVGYGLLPGQDKLALKLRPAETGRPGSSTHVAFTAPNHAAVDACFAAALAHGGRDNGAPGLR